MRPANTSLQIQWKHLTVLHLWHCRQNKRPPTHHSTQKPQDMTLPDWQPRGILGKKRLSR